MEQKALGVLQIAIGVIFFGLLIFGLIVDIIVGEPIRGIILKSDVITLLLFSIFALVTGWHNMFSK